MGLLFTLSRLPIEPVQGSSRLTVVCGRLLLTFAFLLLALMPITEHLWTFDRFLRGGPDLELGLFALISILCLVAVLSRHRRQVLAILLAVHRLLTSALQTEFRPFFPMEVPVEVPNPPLLSLSLFPGSLPLQI